MSKVPPELVEMFIAFAEACGGRDIDLEKGTFTCEMKVVQPEGVWRGLYGTSE